MRKIYFLFVILSFFCQIHSVLAQTPSWAWAQSGTSSQGSIAQAGIGRDAAGNTYITGYGYTTGGMVFGNTTLPPIGMFLVKYNSNGKLVWAKQQPTCMPKALYTDAAGNCYITGMFRDTLRAGNTTLLHEGWSDIFVMKFDSTGNLAWARKAGGPGRFPQTPPPINNEDEGTTIATDAAGNVYVGGYYFARFNTTAAFDSVLLPIPANAPIYHQLGFLAKYNAAGQIQWVRTTQGNSSDDAIQKIAVTPQGNCYVAGTFQNSITYGPNGDTLTSNGSYDACYAMFDTNGNLMWSKGFGGAEMDVNNAIAVDKQGQCFLAGFFYSPNMQIGNNNLTGSPNRGTVYVAKCDSSGNILWAAQTTGSGSIGDSDMAVDTAGNAYLTSSFSGTVTIGQQSITASSATSSLAVSKWSSAGVPLWALTTQGRGGEFRIAAGTVPDECYIAGNFMSGMTFGSHSVSSPNYGVFVAKLSSQPTGIKELAGQELSVYPNPAQQFLYLNLPEIKGEFQVRLSDLQGKTVLFREVKASPETRLELPKLAKGVYILQAQTGKQVYRNKVIIE